MILSNFENWWREGPQKVQKLSVCKSMILQPKNWSKGCFLIRKLNGIQVSNPIFKFLIFGQCRLIDLPSFWPRGINFKNQKYDCIQFLQCNLNFGLKIFLSYFRETQFFNLLRPLSPSIFKIGQNQWVYMIYYPTDNLILGVWLENFLGWITLPIITHYI